MRVTYFVTTGCPPAGRQPVDLMSRDSTSGGGCIINLHYFSYLMHDLSTKKVQPPPEVECGSTGSPGCLPAGGQPGVSRNETRIRGLVVQ